MQKTDENEKSLIALTWIHNNWGWLETWPIEKRGKLENPLYFLVKTPYNVFSIDKHRAEKTAKLELIELLKQEVTYEFVFGENGIIAQIGRFPTPEDKAIVVIENPPVFSYSKTGFATLEINVDLLFIPIETLINHPNLETQGGPEIS